MATSTYLNSRKKYGRPQAMLWSENPGTLKDGYWIPEGYEIGADISGAGESELTNQFIILSDDNRGPLEFSIERLEKRERTVNGRMRSYHIADKLSLQVSWDMLPSRSFALDPEFSSSGSTSLLTDQQYTSDNGAGGVELLDWYESHTGPFWVFLGYDKYSNFDAVSTRYQKLDRYNEVIEMFISDFSYSVEKRGTTNFDFWNVQLTLEEV